MLNNHMYQLFSPLRNPLWHVTLESNVAKGFAKVSGARYWTRTRGKCVAAREENSGDSRCIKTLAPGLQAKLCERTQTMAAQEIAANKII